MMNEAQISALIDRKIQATLKTPGRFLTYESVRGIARSEAYSVVPIPTSITTTNATPTEAVNIPVVEGEAGILEVKVLAMIADGSASAAIYRAVHYKNYGAGLALDGVFDWFNDDTAGIVVLIQDDGSDNIQIQLTGIAATVIDWDVYTTKLNKTASALP